MAGYTAGVVLYFQNMCRAQEFMRRGDRCRAGMAFAAGMQVPAKLLVQYLTGGASDLLSRLKMLQSAGTAAMKCWESDFAATARCGPAPGGFRDGDSSAFADSLATWMAEAIDSTETDVADALAVAGNCYLRVEADGTWADADSFGVVLAQVLSFGEAGGLATVTKQAHDLHGSETDNPHSAATFRLRSRVEQPVALSLLHGGAAGGRVILRYAEFAATDRTLLALPVRDDQEAFPLFVDVDGDGMIDEIHYPGGIVVGAEMGGSPGVRTELDLPYPNPFHPTTTLSFTLGEPGRTTLSIYDPAGRLVARPLEAILTAGPHAAAWDGRGKSGARLPSGVYFVRLETGLATITRQLVLIR